MAFTDPTERDAVQGLAYDLMDLSTTCAALATTVKNKMPSTILTQSKMAADAAGVRPAIFYTASQGEETIWMGPSIEKHINDGRYVIIVLCTDGGASTVRASTGLSVQDFTAARDREMVAALARYGIDQSQIMVEHVADGGLTTPAAERIMAKYIQQFPGASHKTTSWRSNTAQSRNLGYALHNLANSTPLTSMAEISAPTDVRFYIPRPNWSNIAGLAGPPFYESGGQKTLDAIYQYTVSDPAQGRYAISQRTEPGAYSAVAADNRVLIHANNAGAAT